MHTTFLPFLLGGIITLSFSAFSADDSSIIDSTYSPSSIFKIEEVEEVEENGNSLTTMLKKKNKEYNNQDKVVSIFSSPHRHTKVDVNRETAVVQYLGKQAKIPQSFIALDPSKIVDARIEQLQQEAEQRLSDHIQRCLEQLQQQIDQLSSSTSLPTEELELEINVLQLQMDELKKQRDQRLINLQIQSVRGGSIKEKNISVLFYSQTFRIRFFLTKDIRHWTMYSKEDLFGKSENEEEEKIVDECIKDLNLTLNTSHAEVSSIKKCIQYLDKDKIASIEGTTPLRMILNIYKTHKELFTNISKDIQECNKKYRDKKKRKEEVYLVFKRLIDEKVFESILNEKFYHNVEAHINIYKIILGWEDLDRSFLLTCRIGAQKDNKKRDNEYAKDFYNMFIFPFMENLLMNPKGYYYSLSSFFCDDFGTQYQHKRGHLVRFSVEGVDAIPAIGLWGYMEAPPITPTPMATTPTAQQVIMEVAPKKTCVMM